MTFVELILAVLTETGQPMTADQIWSKADEMGLIASLHSAGKTPKNTMSAQLTGLANKGTSVGRFKENKTYRYFLKCSDKQISKDTLLHSMPGKQYMERDLHPLLVRFANTNEHFKAFVKTIYHETSIKGSKGENEWVHPDLVGFYFPYETYSPLTRELANQFNQNQYRLFSFEMKREVHYGNLREYFFQAVSNSSWANEGYLVALHFSKEEKFISELGRLSNAFGIGVIELNPENVDQSQILFPARENQIDWDTVDKLVLLNKSFQNFLESVEGDIKAGKAHPGEYDQILTDQQMREWIDEKNIK